jgi:hypothetical protein
MAEANTTLDFLSDMVGFSLMMGELPPKSGFAGADAGVVKITRPSRLDSFHSRRRIPSRCGGGSHF